MNPDRDAISLLVAAEKSSVLAIALSQQVTWETC